MSRPESVSSRIDFVAATFGSERLQAFAVKFGRTAGYGVVGVASQDARQSALARAIGAHDSVHFARADCEVDATQYFLAVDSGMEVVDFQKYIVHCFMVSG